MATDKKISELPDATLPISSGVKFEAIQGGVNVKVDADDMPGGGGGGTWGSITGTLSSQTDLQTALNAKFTTASASETVQGIIEIATQAETNTGTDDARAVTPVKLTNATVVTNKQLLVNSAVVLTDAATIDLTAIKHTLATSAATRTFTISYTGDDITMEVTLSAATATYTFPATALCVSEGTASGDNTCVLNGVSGDKYMFAIKKVGSAYYVVVKNFGQ